jgi:DNA phosphorothioation-associated putative methyltransferase
VKPEWSVFDYGCGHGGDVKRLKKLGIDCAGWDPAHAPSQERRCADFVNLGYVVNVIEDPAERVEALRGAWELTTRVLVVSARLVADQRDAECEQLEDGCVTRIGTFQKYYDQSELREWIEAVLEERPLPAAPGVFFVFRDSEEKERYWASRYRRRLAAPQPRKSDLLFAEHRETLEPLMDFFLARGRLPHESEIQSSQLVEQFGTLRRAFTVVKRATDPAKWIEVTKGRMEDLLIYLSLSLFNHTKKFSSLPDELRRDIRAFWGNYKAACERAQAFMLTVGDQDNINIACRNSPVGKVTPQALYLHRSALDQMPVLLRAYESCAQGFVGEVPEANIIKLHRYKPQVTYLSYPGFDKVAHPELHGSVLVMLDRARVSARSYKSSASAPILHRKEDLVDESYQGSAKFAKLTQQEERKGLYENTHRIGTAHQWETLLRRRGLRIQGHRLLSANPPM